MKNLLLYITILTILGITIGMNLYIIKTGLAFFDAFDALVEKQRAHTTDIETIKSAIFSVMKQNQTLLEENKELRNNR